MFPSLAARETYVAETNFAARKQKLFCLKSKLFPSLATMKTMLTRFQCRSLSKNCLLSVLTTIKMADCEEIEAGHAKKKTKGKFKFKFSSFIIFTLFTEQIQPRNWKDEIKMLITLYEERPCLWDVGHKD